VSEDVNPPATRIRALESLADYAAAEEAQRTIWGMTEALEVVPTHVLLTAQKNGGLVAGAFDSQDRMVGMLFGFLGLTASGRVKHCSHLMGVLPELRRSGVGEALKRFQREYVLAQNVELITWTFDPLEGVNASLNIGKLRTIARTYHANLYGNMPDGLNAGIESDRFEVEWWLRSERVVSPAPRRTFADFAGAPVINPALFGDDRSVPRPGHIATFPGSPPPALLVEIPGAYQAVKAHSLALAQAWRLHIRTIFERAFADGYTVTDFISDKEANTGRRNFYVLQHNPDIPAL
jgi:predicted GNAT superfamily acetyltransferase